MAEEQTPAKGEETPATGEEQTPEEPLGEGGKKALEAERKARREVEAKLKALEPLAQKAKELEDAQKSEQQKLADGLAAAKAEGSQATVGMLRLEVALDKAPEGMSAAKIRKLAKRLSGSTRDELEADADELFAEFAEEEREEPPRRPQEKLRSGAAPSAEPSEDIRKIVDEVSSGL